VVGACQLLFLVQVQIDWSLEGEYRTRIELQILKEKVQRSRRYMYIAFFMCFATAMACFIWDLFSKINTQEQVCPQKIQAKFNMMICPNNEVFLATIILLYIVVGLSLLVSTTYLITKIDDRFSNQLRGTKCRLILVLAAFIFSFVVKIIFDSLYTR